MASPGGGGALFYTPEPHERPYYDGLFQAADTNRTGNIGGGEAVAFFSRSKLPLEQLKNVWTVADNPPSNSLNRPKFAVAIRLIQLLQNGVKGQGASLAVPPGTPLRPVFLEGISGAVVPLPGPQQHQQQQLAPQQQQPPAQPNSPHLQQPTPPQAQQQPPNDGRPPVPQSPGPENGSTALTVQDPYTLVPNERARYESIFPQYADQDGFMHGKEAVALFSKSGLDQTQLRDIWNMADQPVDNKLDKLEFAIAMHLIVCISKKNLPLPKILPLSLKSLKQQQQQQPPGGSGFIQQQQQPPSVPDPTTNQPPQMNAPAADEGSLMGGPPSGLQGPPPIAQPGGMGISDAFEGLSTGGDGMGSMPPPTSGFSLGGGLGSGSDYGGAPSSEPSPKVQPTQPPRSMSSPPAMHEMPPPTMAPSMPEPPKTSEALAQSYNMSDHTGELEKLKAVLQKLQAENISLKAQLGTMSEEEKEVQRHINATVAEIGDLSNRLTTLRAQVLASKSRLMEATAELKAAREKKGVLNDLIGEAEATKDAIDYAYEGIEASANAVQAPLQAPAPAAFEGDLFGFGPPGGGAPAQPPAPPAAPPAMAPSYNANSGPLQPQVSAPAPYPAPSPGANSYQHDGFGAPGGGSPGQHQIETVSSDDSSEGGQENFNTDVQGVVQQEEMFLYNQQPPANPYQQNPYGGPGQDLAPVQTSSYGQEAPDAPQGVSFEQGFRPNPPTHNKQSSISSLSFEVMGGGPVPQNQFAPQGQDGNQFALPPQQFAPPQQHFAPPQQQQQQQQQPQATPSQQEGADNDRDVVIATSMEEVEGLKHRAKEAADLARDSEGTLRHLMKKTDKLRAAADRAEIEARQKMAEATEKKGGLLGGKKKKSMKEATQAKHDAEAKKKQFLAAQAQANDAQAVAMETKREADKLSKHAEQAELDAAAAASMQTKQPDPELAAPMQSQPPPPVANGYQHHGQQYGQPQGYGQSPMGGPRPPSMGGPPPPSMGGPPQVGQPPGQGGLGVGYGQPPPNSNYGQFNPNVMGQPQGGIEIPSPAAGAADPYANPF